MAAPTPNQSYLVKQCQTRLAAALGVIMAHQGCNVTHHDDFKGNPMKIIYYPMGWRTNKQDFPLRRHAGSRKPLSHAGFDNVGWDGQDSDLKYGAKSIDQNINEAVDEKTQIIKNNTDDVVHVAYEEEVDLTNSFSTSISHGVTLDMTEEAKVASEQKVSGEYMGVSAEVGLSEEFGVSKSKSQSTEEGKEQSEEGTKAQKLAIDFEANPRTYYLVEVNKEHERTRQPFDILGVLDMDVVMQFNDPHTKTVHCKGIEGFSQWVYGYDTNHPDMQGYMGHAPQAVKDAVAFIQDPANRTIKVSGTNLAELDSNADYNVEELGQHIPDALAHLPVKDAEDVQA